MSDSSASESTDDHVTLITRVTIIEEDEGNENNSSIIETEAIEIPSTEMMITTATDQFMYTPEFRRHFVEFVHVQTLTKLRLATKGWNAAADAMIYEGLQSGELIVHDGKDISYDIARHRKEICALISRAIFLLTKIGEHACAFATNLIIVEIPEGIERIGENAFYECRSLTTVSFPTTLRLIEDGAFGWCSSLKNIDLLHTNLQELGNAAFDYCSELKSMTIPNSLKTFGDDIFYKCDKLVPDCIDINDEINDDDVTSEVIAHLRSQQLFSTTPPAPTDLTASSASTVDNFMATVNVMRLLVVFVHASTLMKLRFTTKAWKIIADEAFDQGVASGEILVHEGKNINWNWMASMDIKHELVTRVIFLLNIIQLGRYSCAYASNLVVIDIPEGVTLIGYCAFSDCKSITSVSFPKTLTVTDECAFSGCITLENVDLRHTNLKEIREAAFEDCFKFKSMMVPDSLHKFCKCVFSKCFELVPSNIGLEDNKRIVAHLRKL
ncbi:hypothetical protein TL16_g06390 [Triparma laevis f. inornata]|uniref:Uncharacterized protein n=1 Tax=Triparma laevis f. inornata TaxID=1714386 RepID=A0A9W7AKY1_9STRA|nr:hypothetical protein TL16_g06390 [Triparma laevis f. inornata]